MQNILCLIPLIAAGAAILYFISSYDSIPVNVDAGYYLSISREVAGGATPTVDVITSYTPGVYYLFALWMKLAGTDFESSLLLVFFVHLLNCLLLYHLLGFFLKNAFFRTVLVISYFFSVYFLEGYSIALEPFQILFALSAYLAYLYWRSGTAGYVAAGFLFGCSVMCKQYSVILFAGFLVSVYLDSRGRDPWTVIIKRMLISVISAVCPYLIFIATTDARILDSLHDIAFLRRNPVFYMSQGRWDAAARVRDIVWKSLEVHWLFIPVLIYIISRSFRKDFICPKTSIIPLMLASLTPLLVRQFSHYFQFIAPWSFIILAVTLNDAYAGLKSAEMDNRYVLGSCIFCTAVMLPVSVFYSPYFTTDFYMNHKIQLFSVMALYLGSITLTIAMGMYRSGYPSGLRFLTLLATALIFFEVIFICLRLPLHDWKAQKTLQGVEAVNLHKVFPALTPVLVLGYPQLYITCNFVNPLHNYDVIFPELGNIAMAVTDQQWNRVRNVIVRREGLFGLREEILRRGFMEIESTETQHLLIFSRR